MAGKLCAVLIAFLSLTAAAAGATPAPSRMILQFSDLPSGFAQDFSHHVSATQARKENGGWLSPGFQAGWEAQYSRQAITGIIQISSRAGVYATPSAAHNSLAHGYTLVQRERKLKRLSVGAPPGDEARMYSYTATSAGYHVIVYVVAWRDGRVKAGVLAGGIVGTVDPARIVRLARKQHARILAVS
jgi:hypothetical protein